VTNEITWITFVSERIGELGLRIGEHLMLTGVSTGIAILIGIPLGICAARIWWLRNPIMGGIGIFQTIPSLAILAIILVLLHKIGAIPAIIALTIYALLPIVRNTLTGLTGIPPKILEAARGIGMTSRQQLWMIEIPLSMPVIMAGIRTAAVVSVGIATLSAFIGAGGLGQFINRGLALMNTDLILLGAIPAAILALIVDGSIAAFQWGLHRKRSKGTRFKAAVDRLLRPAALSMPAVLIAAGCFAYYMPNTFSSKTVWEGSERKVRIGTKNFTEQMILGELMAQLIESHTDLDVMRLFNLGGTMICHEALKSGEIDLYAEYTGTALTAILNQPVIIDPDRACEMVNREYQQQFAAEWLRPFGFNNTYTITVRKADALAKDLRTITDLTAISGTLRAGFTAEFSERSDGLPGLNHAYGIQFQTVQDLEPSLMYQAIANGEVDVICAFATDGRISAYDLQPLQDDRGFFPPYQAAPVIRNDVLKTHPELRQVLDQLAGLLDDTMMQQLNLEVDEMKHRLTDVARKFLEEQGLLGKKE